MMIVTMITMAITRVGVELTSFARSFADSPNPSVVRALGVMPRIPGVCIMVIDRVALAISIRILRIRVVGFQILWASMRPLKPISTRLMILIQGRKRKNDSVRIGIDVCTPSLTNRIARSFG